jgi:hypothetical protein
LDFEAYKRTHEPALASSVFMGDAGSKALASPTQQTKVCVCERREVVGDEDAKWVAAFCGLILLFKPKVSSDCHCVREND